jgi:hypothetical protein
MHSVTPFSLPSWLAGVGNLTSKPGRGNPLALFCATDGSVSLSRRRLGFALRPSGQDIDPHAAHLPPFSLQWCQGRWMLDVPITVTIKRSKIFIHMFLTKYIKTRQTSVRKLVTNCTVYSHIPHPPPHVNSFVLGPAVINTHTQNRPRLRLASCSSFRLANCKALINSQGHLTPVLRGYEAASGSIVSVGIASSCPLSLNRSSPPNDSCLHPCRGMSVSNDSASGARVPPPSAETSSPPRTRLLQRLLQRRRSDVETACSRGRRFNRPPNH